jgi:hypothetical protein
MVAMATPTLKPIATRAPWNGANQEAGLQEQGFQTLGGPEADGNEPMELELKPHLHMNPGAVATPVFPRCQEPPVKFFHQDDVCSMATPIQHATPCGMFSCTTMLCEVGHDAHKVITQSNAANWSACPGI